MNVSITTKPDATKRNLVAALQWLENITANAAEQDLGSDELEFAIVIQGEDAPLVAQYIGRPENLKMAFTVIDTNSSFSYSESFWVEEDGPPALLYGTEDPEHAVIELDLSNRNIPGYE